MNRKTETAGFPYADRPMWLYLSLIHICLLGILVTLTMEQRSRRRNTGKHFKF